MPKMAIFEAHVGKISAKPGFKALLGRGQAFQANLRKGYFGQMWPKPEK